ncbi:MAG: TIGR02757 family protein [Dysgonamonadaceae bacterium]|jgi:uncharacterized protein (TIGR02757 family)|nr:TIGR02757 family protein [Dysgonamonadaceae bacterium]
MNKPKIKSFLDELVAQFNTPSFIESDPVQFPLRYERLQDIEIVSFTVATIAWGKRPMILRDAERMLAKMGGSPFDFVMNEDYRALGKANVHRTFFEPDLAYMLRGFRRIFERFGSVENMLIENRAAESAAPAWTFAGLLSQEMRSANGGQANSLCYPASYGQSALKRLNMAVRWLVRNDGIVDRGVWKALKPSQLYIPLDVHVGNVARELGILSRKSNDRKAVEELTAVLREFCPEDPVIYDFALFGAGITGKLKK